MHLPYRLEDELGSKLEQLEEQLKDKMEEETKLRHTILFCHTASPVQRLNSWTKSRQKS